MYFSQADVHAYDKIIFCVNSSIYNVQTFEISLNVYIYVAYFE